MSATATSANRAHVVYIVALLVTAALASQMGRRAIADLGVSDRVSGLSVFVIWPVASLLAAVWSFVLVIARRRLVFGVLAGAAVVLLGGFTYVMSAPN